MINNLLFLTGPISKSFPSKKLYAQISSLKDENYCIRQFGWGRGFVFNLKDMGIKINHCKNKNKKPTMTLTPFPITYTKNDWMFFITN